MTREEAIKILKPIRDTYVDHANIAMTVEADNDAEALEMAVESLEQQEIIRCKDCKHYHTDVWGQELGIEGLYGHIIVAHNACDRWSEHMNSVDPYGFCFLAERKR